MQERTPITIQYADITLILQIYNDKNVSVSQWEIFKL